MGGQVKTMFSRRLTVFLNVKGRIFLFVGEKGQQLNRSLG